MVSVGLASMSTGPLDLFPNPISPVLFGIGLGLFAVTMPLLKRQLLTPSIADPKALPKVPGRSKVRLLSRSSDKDGLLRRYDLAFADLKDQREALGRASAFERLKPIVFELGPELQAWRGEARLRVYLLLKEIAKDFDDPDVSKASTGLLVFVLSKGGPSAVDLARPLFYEKVSSMYADPSCRQIRFVPRLLLLLDNFEKERVETMTIDAIHFWEDQRFEASAEYLGFESLRGSEVQTGLKELLGKEISKAELANNESALARASELYSSFA